MVAVKSTGTSSDTKNEKVCGGVFIFSPPLEGGEKEERALFRKEKLC